MRYSTCASRSVGSSSKVTGIGGSGTFSLSRSSGSGSGSPLRFGDDRSLRVAHGERCPDGLLGGFRRGSEGAELRLPRRFFELRLGREACARCFASSSPRASGQRPSGELLHRLGAPRTAAIVSSVTSQRSRSGRSTVMRWKPNASFGKILTFSPSSNAP